MLTPNTWNVISESIRREYGFSQHIEKRIYNSGLFYKSSLGSLLIAERMQFSHLIREKEIGIHTCLHFKNDGNLICTGNYDRHVYIYDWKTGRQTFSMKTKHSDVIGDIKFLRTGGNGMDIISSCYGGQVRHACIAPDGHFASKRILLKNNCKHILTLVPENPLEFIAANRNADIFLVDLRSERFSSVPISKIKREKGFFVHIRSIAHHPLRPEICICGIDEGVQIFDKRNLKNVVKRLYPKGKKSTNIDDCSYNYNGNEILISHRDRAYLLDNTSNETEGYLHMYERCIVPYLNIFAAKFFGPKSEFILRGANFRNICLQVKNTEKIVEPVYETAENEEVINYSFMELDIHPHLPVIASSSGDQGFAIWAPTPLKLNVDEPEI